MASRKPSSQAYGTLFQAGKSASTLFVLFIPSHDRDGRPVDQAHWRDEALGILGRLFGGATA